MNVTDWEVRMKKRIKRNIWGGGGFFFIKYCVTHKEWKILV